MPPGNDIRFRVIRNGSQIGSHELSFSAVANGFDVRIAVDIAVYFGPIRLFHYKLAGVEQWRDGKVAQVTTDTDDDGTAAYIRANRDEQGLWVTGSSAKRRYLATPGALPATHWNQAELDGPWINPQDGKLFHPVVNSRGVEQVTIGGGTARSATHYDLSGDVTLQAVVRRGTAMDRAIVHQRRLRCSLRTGLRAMSRPESYDLPEAGRSG